MRRPGDGKRARSESRCCPRVPLRRRRFYSESKRLLLGAFASEAQWRSQGGGFGGSSPPFVNWIYFDLPSFSPRLAYGPPVATRAIVRRLLMSKFTELFSWVWPN